MIDITQAEHALYRALETEAAAIAVYDAATASATNHELRDEWRRHREAKAAYRRELEAALRTLRLDADAQTASRHVIRHLGQSMACSVKMATQSMAPALAELVAVECVVHAETASRHHWTIVERIGRALPAGRGAVLQKLAHRILPEQEEHIERAEHWLAELSLAVLGVPAAFPPALPESDQPLPLRGARLYAAHARPLPRT